MKKSVISYIIWKLESNYQCVIIFDLERILYDISPPFTFKMSLIDAPNSPELKFLPKSLNYAYLGPIQPFLVIISSHLSSHQENQS